ncbi:MAG: hypothetical protein DRQ51_02415 [Gammaproteobacteria bacterium]|nr:MAG: hypothetical protein DRQ51_02415 [Gammaproteobacteria bacterium]
MTNLTKILKIVPVGVIIIIALSVLYRLIPHPPNFTPILSMALFAGCYINNKKLAVLLPLLTMLVSDLLLGFHNTMIFVYGALFIAVLMGSFFIQNKVKIHNVFLTTIMASFVFFIITNFAVWLMGDFYPYNFAGLIQSYLAGLAFWQNAIIGDLFFVFLFFGSYEFFNKKFLTKLKTSQQSNYDIKTCKKS